MRTVAAAIFVFIAVAPIVGWIAALIWAGVRDGRDEEEFKRTHPPE